MGILDFRESQPLRFHFNPWTSTKGVIEPELEHAEDISPEEESAILANMERRASQVVRRNSENWLASQNSAITQPFDMKNMKFNRRPSEQRNFSNRRSSAQWVD